MKKRKEFIGLLTIILFGITGIVKGQTPPDPIYIRAQEGYLGLFGHNSEYAKFQIEGKAIQLQDAYHMLLTSNTGMMVTFADKKEFGTGEDLLSEHVKWELNYWRSNSAMVESNTRNDLIGGRKDIRVTEIKISRGDGKYLNSYLIGLASKEGVFVLSISPVDKNIDPVVKKIVNSFTLVNKQLDAQEIKRISQELKSKP